MDSQQDLFEREPDPWELDDQLQGRVATVVFTEGAKGEFDYLVPDEIAQDVTPGRRVRVPFGRSNRGVTGYCIRVEQKSIRRGLKEVQKVVDQQTLLSDSMLALTYWMSERYLCPWGRAIEAVVPAGVRKSAGVKKVTLLKVPTSVAARITQIKLPPKQALVLKHLAASTQAMTPGDLALAAGCTTAPISQLRKKGLVEALHTSIHEEPLAETDQPQVNGPTPNDDQKSALDTTLKAVNSGIHQTILIRGVTGSGKTEVYMRTIEEVISFGREALVLVPEISLTPQTRQRFRERFEHVAVLHSHLSDAQRHWHWKRIARGEVHVVVGARSAVFAPTPNLGLIVLDEEHDNSFKQDTAPRYHARSVAIERARLHNIPVILGSATPALETWQRAISGEYTLIEMARRVLGRRMPDVSIVDLRDERVDRYNRGAISRPLFNAINQTLSDDGQVILLLNRRGFSTHIQCPACGEVVRCKNCDIALTHHRDGERVVCHYCDFTRLAPPNCPDCGFEGIRYGGLGTQKLEAEVRARFPKASCLRMDSDTMQRAGSHEQALAKFRCGDAQILLGTQMIAKGLDFPNVTLVGVINADVALHLPDFRAAERTFQLITQVAGRTGRGERGGHVVVQTLNPDHPAVEAAQHHDYVRFANGELPIRQQFNYPPFGALARIVARGTSEQRTGEFIQHLADMIRHQSSDADQLRLLGPTAAPLARLRNRYRFHMLLQAPKHHLLRDAIRHVQVNVKPLEDVQWIADLDPGDML